MSLVYTKVNKEREGIRAVASKAMADFTKTNLNMEQDNLSNNICNNPIITITIQ